MFVSQLIALYVCHKPEGTPVSGLAPLSLSLTKSERINHMSHLTTLPLAVAPIFRPFLCLNAGDTRSMLVNTISQERLEGVSSKLAQMSTKTRGGTDKILVVTY